MTEQNVPPQDSPLFEPHPWNASGAPKGEAAPVEPSPNPGKTAERQVNAQSEADWEPVELPGTLPIEALMTGQVSGAEADAPPPPPAVPKVAEFSQREAELLQLIQDLNQCNDALLGRVGDLEDALERSQAALQIEIERAQQNQSMTSAEAQAAIAQQQQQTAQLLSELDIANDAVRRTTIHNETLQAELDNTRQRVAQLERECTLLQQRFTEKSNALQQAEATCRDLRSRLQRQQHYTLQFKAALEKCLDMSHRSPAAAAIDFPAVIEEPTLRPHPLAMPKAQQIKPWSSTEAAPTRPDLTLDTLLRNLKSVGQGPGTPTPSALSSPVPGPTLPPTAPSNPVISSPDPEAESQLWQDLERVIETSAPKDSTREPVGTKADPNPASGAAGPAFTEPSPWGAPLSPPPSSAEPAETFTDRAVAEMAAEIAADVAAEMATDPTPPPRPSAPPTVAAGLSMPPVPTGPSGRSQTPGSVLPPTLGGDPAASQSPSPVVYPLRPQKKLKSIAAVQLPTFPRKQRSQ
ncbi:MAG TPA: hypothetical protein V6D06_03210 [Trichocoleus sp.]